MNNEIAMRIYCYSAAVGHQYQQRPPVSHTCKQIVIINSPYIRLYFSSHPLPRFPPIVYVSPLSKNPSPNASFPVVSGRDGITSNMRSPVYPCKEAVCKLLAAEIKQPKIMFPLSFLRRCFVCACACAYKETKRQNTRQVGDFFVQAHWRVSSMDFMPGMEMRASHCPEKKNHHRMQIHNIVTGA